MINVYTSAEETVKNFAVYLETLIKVNVNENNIFNVALSGGSTPKLLFKELRENYSKKIDWSYVHFYWGDERCVPSESLESNYGEALRIFLNSKYIPINNIHKIDGENSSGNEAERYSEEISNYVPFQNGFPSFDLIILGIGEDGHTASIFPNQMELIDSEKICEVAIHPDTGQKRITITGRVINNAKNVSFLVTGKKKSIIIGNILNKRENYKSYPAAHVYPKFGKLTYHLDEVASSFFNKKGFNHE